MSSKSRKLAVASAVLLGSLWSSGNMPAEAHTIKGRCPQYERLLAKYDLPVQTFSRIMWRESRCKATARHVNRNGSIDRGLMQINSIHLRSPYGVAKQYRSNPSALFNPEVNIRITAKLYHRAGMRPWR